MNKITTRKLIELREQSSLATKEAVNTTVNTTNVFGLSSPLVVRDNKKQNSSITKDSQTGPRTPSPTEKASPNEKEEKFKTIFNNHRDIYDVLKSLPFSNKHVMKIKTPTRPQNNPTQQVLLDKLHESTNENKKLQEDNMVLTKTIT